MIDKQRIQKTSEYLQWLEQYHDYEVVGMENIPLTGPYILAVNHSFATYDIVLLVNRIYKETGRLPRMLADRWFFKFKPVADFVTSFGVEEGNPQKARKILEQGHGLCLAPGGMREAIRPCTERYQIIWDKRQGFVRLAVETQTPIVLAACPKADDIFDILPNPLALPLYKAFKIPFAILRGLGPTPIPRPVKLVHHIAAPLPPPKAAQDENARQRQIKRFHKKVIKEMKKLIGEAIAYRPQDYEI